MNKVDAEVRNLLNAFPTLFQNRSQALLNIFTNSGYSWNHKTGCIVRTSAFDRDLNTMDYSDLDKRQARLDEYKAENSPVNDLEQFDIDQERMVRKHRAAHIDLVASIKEIGAVYRYDTLKHLYFDYSLETAPFGKIDPEWLEALEEFLSILDYSFNVAFSLQYDTPIRGEQLPEPSMFSRMPVEFQKLKTTIDDIAAKVEAQSGKKARMAAFWEKQGKAMIEEIINEDK